MIGLYWGRFNPPHKGHMSLIKKVCEEVDSLIVAIGSAQDENTKRNPFNGKERKQMMEAFIKEENLDSTKIKVVPVPDGTSFSSSIKNLFELSPPFDIIYTDKETIIKLVEHKAKFKRIKRTGSISSTKIRNAIADEGRWEHLTGKSVVLLIDKLKGVDRIKRAYGKE